jgi:hypothetical protein
MMNPEIQQLFIELQKAKKKRLKRRLSVSLEEAVVNELKGTDSDFEALILENNDLLTNKSIKLKVYEEGGGPWGTHAKKLEGKTHHNGYMYLQTTKQMSVFMPFATNIYPTRFSGSIKWNGSIQLDATETDFNLFGGRVPQLFSGRIDNNGKVEMRVIDSDFDFFGNFLINKLICDPFNKNEQKRNRYLSNLSKLNKRYDEYLKKINTAHNME